MLDRVLGRWACLTSDSLGPGVASMARAQAPIDAKRFTVSPAASIGSSLQVHQHLASTSRLFVELQSFQPVFVFVMLSDIMMLLVCMSTVTSGFIPGVLHPLPPTALMQITSPCSASWLAGQVHRRSSRSDALRQGLTQNPMLSRANQNENKPRAANPITRASSLPESTALPPTAGFQGSSHSG